jgi:amino acid adenylation domain-containing protein/non-ribosomal peptide synthase protein (TIGR01720 family)
VIDGEKTRNHSEKSDPAEGTDVALIGMAGRFPGAGDIDTFWRNIREGRESISFFTEETLRARGVAPAALDDPYYVKAGAVLEGVERFDASFFGYPPGEAERIDPQHRLFLETAWEALENAGYDPEVYAGLIGVYAGAGVNLYLLLYLRSLLRAVEERGNLASLLSLMTGNDKDFLATRVSYKLDLRGPSITVQTACSTSLVAVHLACRGLLNYEADMTLAGGVSINLLQGAGYAYQPGGILSPDGHCRVFDARATGTVIGSGVGVVVLKRLSDALAEGDTIHAVIKGSAINNDGSLKVGYTAPSVEGQSEVILAAQAIAGVPADSIGYIEAHGTGTHLGDPVEIAALTQAFRASTPKRKFCAIGSVKTNVGHLDAAAGVTGLIKTALALKHRILPPSFHFERPNPQIDFERSPFYVNVAPSEWKEGPTPRRAGVSSFGMGGTNAHIILEEAPPQGLSGPSRPWQLLPLSARTPTALEAATTCLLDHFRMHPDLGLADVAYTLQVGRRHFAHRRVAICRDYEEALRILEGCDPERFLTAWAVPGDRSVAFLFPGQGAQHVEMALELYWGESAFREEVDRCVDLLKPNLGFDLREVLYPGEEKREAMSERLNQTAITQPALFVIEYALARLWMEWGVHPEAMIGHSIGEYVAACIAGVLSLEEALFLVAARGRLLQSLPEGAMIAVALPEEEVRPLLKERCALAAVNGPTLSVLSGPIEAIETLERCLAGRGIAARRLHVSHAFHSDMVEPILPRFLEAVRKVDLRPPRISFLSNVSGRWITEEEATDPGYWVRHLRQTVLFADGLHELLNNPKRILLEVGPGETLSVLARRHLSAIEHSALRNPHSEIHTLVLSSLPHPQKRHLPAWAHLLGSVGRLWLAGIPIAWPRFYAEERRRRIPLPAYPFERQCYWVDSETESWWSGIGGPEGSEMEAGVQSAVQNQVAYPRPALQTPYAPPQNELEQRIAEIWQGLLRIDRVGHHDPFFELGGDSLLAIQLLSRLRAAFQMELSPADFFETPTVAGLARIAGRMQDRPTNGMVPPIPPRATPDPPPLSFSQERLWFLDQLESGSPFYHLPAAIHIQGRLDPTAVEDALNQIVRRHEVLRTTFATVDGRPVQVIAPEWGFSIPVIDLCSLSEREREAEVKRLAAEEAQRPFHLEKGPLLRVSLLHLEEQEHVLLLTMHHIISDGWSLGILLREFAALYQESAAGRPSPFPELLIQYADYACWQRQWLSGEVLERPLAYWKRQLQGAAALALPTDRPRPAVQTYRGSTYTFDLPVALTESLRGLSRQQGMTLFMTLLAAFQVLLSRYSGQEDLCIGTPVANRSRLEIEPLIGFFANTLVLRTDLSGDPAFVELAKRVREVVLGAQAHQDLPFEKLVEALQPVRDLSYTPLFQAMFSLQRAHLETVEIPGLGLRRIEIENRYARFDLTLDMTESEGGLTGSFEYSTDLFDEETIVRMAEHYRTLLEEIAAHPEARLSDLPMLTEAERYQVLVEWNATEAGYPQDRCIHQLFKAQVESDPDRVAVMYEGQQLTYDELNARADQLARHLRRQGIGPDVLVGLCMERSIEMVVGLLGILKAGGAYLPIDPNYPRERIVFMLEDAQVSVLLTQQKLLECLPETQACRVCVDGDFPPDSSFPAAGPRLPAPDPQNLAYVLYTSGSTGRPKGVQISHRSAVNFLWAIREQLKPTGQELLLAVTSLSFDIALLELFLPLMVGARVVLAGGETAHDGARLSALLERCGATFMQATPATWRMLLEGGWLGKPGLKALCGGEVLSTELASGLLKRGVVLWNLYGPTETTVWSGIHRVTGAAGPIPIGHPIANTEIYLLDAHLQPVPIGVPGEIYIGGAGLARGYLNRPDLTAERFVPNPFNHGPGSQLYRTGDLGRWRPDGNTEFLGRIDHQVKVRGYRIELGEIEARLAEHPEVREAVVVAREDLPGEKRLVGYVVAGEEISPGALRDFLRERLPDYMIPSAYVFLEKLPLTPNGKIDRKALPAPDVSTQATHRYEAPRTTTEEILVGIWAEILGVEQVGIHDNFFELGGDSILSIQVISRARQAGVVLTPRQLFQHQTIVELAALMGHGLALPVEEGPIEGEIPLTPIQRWFFERVFPNPHYWNQSLLLVLKRPLDPAILEKAVAHLVAHHDALRLRFVREAGVWKQIGRREVGQPVFHRVDLSAVPVEAQRKRLEEDVAKWEASLHLAEGPLLRVVQFERGGSQPDSLLLIIHHLVTDGISWRILLEDLHVAYRQLSSGVTVALPARTTSYARWARRLLEHVQSGVLQEEAYWLDPACLHIPPLPVENPEGDNRETGAETIHLWLDEGETRSLLHEVPPVYRTQINDVLLTALARVLSHWSRSPSVLIDLEGHGREDLFEGIDLSRTVGWFAGVFPVLLEVSTDAPPGEALKSVKEQLRRVPNRGIGYGMLRYLNPPGGIDERLRAYPASQVRFNYLGQLDQVLPPDSPFIPSVASAGIDHDPQSALPYEIDINSDVLGGQLHLSWTYSRCRYRRETIERLSQDYLETLKGLIRHCLSPEAGGYTPSDFPLSGLDQPTINRLFVGQRQVEDVYPLTPLQQGLLFHSLYAPNSGVYIEQLRCTLLGELNVPLFQQALQEAINRHPVLRTSFLWEGLQEPLQMVHPRVALPIEQDDWRELSSEAQEAQLKVFLETNRKSSFDFSRAPLLRLALIRISDRAYLFIWSHHHILLDGWCVSLLLKEVFSRYEALRRGEREPSAPSHPYRDHITWLKRQDLAAAECYWRASLAGFTAPTPLAVNRGAGSTQDMDDVDYAEQSLLLSEVGTSALSAFAQRHQLTLNTLIQGAWALLLSCYSGEEEVLFGVTVSGRPTDLPGVETMIGLFLNTLPLRVRIASETPVREWLQALLAQNIEMREYEYAPLLQIQGWSEVPRGQPLFESLLVFENYPMDQGLSGTHGSLTMSDVAIGSQTHYPLTVDVSPGTELRLNLWYDRCRFDNGTIRRMLSHFEKLLEGIAVHPEARLSDLPMLTETERHQALVEWNATEAGYPQDRCIHQLFEAQAERTPEAVAVIFEERQLTYQELNARADQLARHLRRQGIGPDVLVGLCMERSIEMVVGLLGILKAGGAYLPIDPNYPRERIVFMLEDAQVSVLLTQQKLLECLPETQACRVCVDGDFPPDSSFPAAGPRLPAPDPQNLAYVLYTSGSTGRPKGVQISHRSAVNFLWAIREQLKPTGQELLLAVTSLSFDIALLELFLPLMVGARVVLAGGETAHDGARLSALLERCGATFMQATPATWRMLLEGGWLGKPGLKALCGGEVLSTELASGLLKRGVVLWNLYGPTETTVWSAIHRVTGAAGPIPIGHPIANTEIYILNAHLQSVPIGVPGEIYIGGAGLAQGYLNRPELTAERFVPSSFSDQLGARLYRTGDLGRYQSDGSIVFLRRLDHQVKLRGFRIELGEVEARLLEHPEVRAAVVIVREDTPGEKRLVGYVVAEPTADLKPEALRAALREKLPEYMIPSAFVCLEKLPLTPNGKVDRNALPVPDVAGQLARQYVAPRTPTEELLAGIWAEVLGLERIGLHDHFFELGGHSLLATQVVSRLRSLFEVELPLRSLFESPTVAELARAVERARAEGAGVPVPPLVAVSRAGELVLSFAQERLWFLDQLEPQSAAYNMPGALRLVGWLDREGLVRAVNEIVRRHEVLRTRFETVAGRGVAVVASELELAIPTVDLITLPEETREAEVRRLAKEEAQRPFDLARGPLLRVRLLDLGVGAQTGKPGQVLLFTLHHIVSDGWSEDILMREFAALYEAFSQGQASPLPELPIQYADYAMWQRGWLQGEVLDRQLSYWRGQLAGAPAALALPTDRPRPAVQSYRGASYEFTVSKEVTTQLYALSREAGVTLFMTLLAAFKTLLYRYTGQKDIVVGTDIANRNRIETERLIGFFVNLLPLRTDLGGNPTFEELLGRIREVTLGAYTHQDLPFGKLVGVLQSARSLGHQPVVQVLFVLQNTPISTLDLPRLKVSSVELSDEVSRFDLGLFVEESEEDLTGSWKYRVDLFDVTTIARMSTSFTTLLGSIVAQPSARLNKLQILTGTEKRADIIKEDRLREANFKKFKKLQNVMSKNVSLQQKVD